MSPTKIILIIVGLAIAVAEVVLLIKITSAETPVEIRYAKSTNRADPKDVDWIAVQNKVLGYKTQKVTPWVKGQPIEPSVHEEPHLLDAKNMAASPNQSVEKKASADTQRVSDTCADGQGCKWSSLWDNDSHPVEPTVPAQQ